LDEVLRGSGFDPWLDSGGVFQLVGLAGALGLGGGQDAPPLGRLEGDEGHPPPLPPLPPRLEGAEGQLLP
jgi:hypothetical protein